MKLSVATNFDNQLIGQIADYPVTEIYGKLTSDAVGGGRASYTTQQVNWPTLISHINCAHKHGIKFNYLLNASCFGNREWTRRGIRDLRRLLDRLSESGVDAVTVSTPYLVEIIRKHYPHLLIRIGIFANIDSPDRARFWEDLGANVLTLESFSINRAFARLATIREAVRCDLQLIVNFTCLSRCPMQVYHMNGISHASNTRDKAPFVDYCVLHCSYRLLKDPTQLIKSQWIRPEDIALYESLGFESFKLLERNAPTEAMVQRVRAYAEHHSPKNLLELLQPFGFQGSTRNRGIWFLHNAARFVGQRLPIRKIKTLLKKRGLLYALDHQPVQLNAAAIPDDFLQRIQRQGCYEIGDCSNCGWCDQIAQKAYTADPQYVSDCLESYGQVFEGLCSR